MTDSDRDLAARFTRTGDEEAFRLLFRRHTPRVYALTLRLLGGRVADAEDVVQEVWSRAAMQLARFEWRSALSTWLVAIAINCARERLRARASRDLPSSDDIAATAVAVTAPPGLALDLERALAELPDRYREVVVLHDVEGFTHVEIARELGIAVGTSKSHLFFGRRALRARLSRRKPEVHDHAG